MTDRTRAILNDLATARTEALALMRRWRPKQAGRPTENARSSSKDLVAHVPSLAGRARASWRHLAPLAPATAP
jgi:hypothetical protein